MASLLVSGLYAIYDIIQSLRGVNGSFITDQHVPGADLTGKWIIITGSNNGVGFEAAKSFAKWGANLILACREPPTWEQHPTAAVADCKRLAEAEGHSSTIEWWELDMADLSNVEAFAQRWLDSDRVLEILCNNAGIGTASPPLTKDGFNVVHQVNFLSHVLLTLNLLPSLARSKEPRIVCTTSCLHHRGAFDLDNFNGGPEVTETDYPNNKLYYQMWVAELQDRFIKHREYLHITINGIHPGFVASGIWHPVKDVGSNIWIPNLDFLLRYFAITPQQGSLAISHAATSPEFGPDPKVQGVGAWNGRGGGMYINRIWEAPSKYYCRDRDARSRLWTKLDEVLHLHDKGLLTVLGR